MIKKNFLDIKSYTPLQNIAIPEANTVKKRALRRLQQFQKDLYEKAFLQASNHPLIDAPTVIKYSEHFYDSLPKTFKKTDINRILKDLDRSDFLLYGDFHTLKQTQKGLVRILRDYIGHNPNRPMVLALEMFKARDQELIDRYLRGDLSEEQFLQLCRYDHTWGFPWENYKIILDFALKQNIRIVGINTDVVGKDQLRTRDKFAAKILQEIHSNNEQALVVCLIGEYHLADEHLPKHLEPEHSYTRILTNIDHYYFLTSNKIEVPNTEYLALKSRLYCVLNSPPWIKWQSYAIWEEIKSAKGELVLDDPRARILYTEESFDLDYQILNILSHLAEFLSINFRKNDLTRFHTYSDPSETDIFQITANFEIDESYVETAIERLDREGFYFIPEGNIILISDVSLNNLAEISGQLLFNLLHPIQDDFIDADRVYHRILMTSSGVLASKVLNPRRRCLDKKQYETFMSQLSRRRLIGYQKKMRESIRMLVRLLERIEQGSRGDLHYKMIEYDLENQMEISIRLGQVIGYETYRKIMKTPNSSFEFANFFQFSTTNLDPKEQYIHLIRCLFP
ncbi:MAG: ChaN family lipoprotein [Oligoflexus sp.]